ncbi:MAG: TonB-dependent receptor [Verrucomicrobiaceae bacterium]|nr:TonB-dependent receptor [Verrucomicrobiaceae bacterium]
MHLKNIPSALATGIGAATMISLAVPAYAQSGGGLEEVFVTARKRDEGVQTVPLSISALSSEALEQRNVRQVEDLNTVVPGFRFGAEGGKANNNIMMRGLSKIPLGEGVPAVVTYFANIGLPPTGGNVPTYDIANIQVLKGPQGTLFGRNTLGGAVVITPVLPELDKVSGYLRGAYGTKDYRSVEGAVSLPIIEDKLAVRIAGQVRRGDGLNKNLSGGADFDNIHQNSYRVSMLFQPTEWFENTTVWDHFEADETGSALNLFRIWPDTLSAIASQFGPLGPQLTTQIQNYAAGQKAHDFHSGYSDVDGGYAKRHSYGVSNDTSLDLGFGTFRNILGWRRHDSSELINTPGTGPMAFNVGAPDLVPFVFYHASAQRSRTYLSDEVQLFGNALDDKLDWIVGVFYNDDKAKDPNGSQSDEFRLVGIQPAPTFVTANVENKNKAVFAQLGLDISDWTIDGLKATLGGRYSKDNVYACGGGNATHFMSESECEDVAKSGGPTDGTGVIKTDDSAGSFTMGLDWQITPETLVYVSHRRGYRGVNANTPAFESANTTGGTPAQVIAQGLTPCQTGAAPIDCPDLRPFQTTKPETLTDWEVGVKNDWTIGDVKGRVNVAAFTSKYKNAVQFINVVGLSGIPSSAPDLPTNASVGVNAADLTINGVEADLTVIPVPSLTLTLSGSYVDQTVDSVSSPSSFIKLSKDEITLPSPKFSGTFAFNWTLPVHPLDGDLIFNGDYYHTDKFSGQGGENLPGYDLANFRLNWNGVAKSGLDVAVYLKNAFDEEYFSSPSVLLTVFPVSTALPGDPRTWGVEATYHF